MKHNLLRYFLFAIISLAVPSIANAQAANFSVFDPANITVCPATLADIAPPDFTSDTCTKGTVNDVDPQGRLIWVKANVALTAVRGKNGEPLSLYISGKMSSEVYLNGEFIGQNGVVGEDALSERVGKMDAEFYPPQSLFHLGENEVIFRASSYNGQFHLKRSLHMVAIAPSGVFASRIFPSFAPALITLGLFLLGALYFGVMAFINTSRVSFLTLSAICIFASAQLVFETMRGIVSYNYPIHDYRLLGIAVFSFAFGLSVAFHIFRIFKIPRLAPLMAGLTIGTSVAVFIIEGFDLKALVGMTLPLLGALIATGFWTYQRRPRAFLYFISLLIFVASSVMLQGVFLDTVFFLLVAFFLMLLFVDQALTLGEEARERRREEDRANRLEQALAEIEERAETNYINIKSAGKMERIATKQIIHCQGASGYSELTLLNGRKVLHLITLNEIEDVLPATFLRVHRSHLINIMHVRSLNRDTSGTGMLKMEGNEDVPVSRRIMPKVRQALA